MNLKDIQEKNRLEEFKAIMRFIEHASPIDCGRIIEEIRCVHDNIYTFNQDTRLFAKIESVSMNGGGIQLNIEPMEKQE